MVVPHSEPVHKIRTLMEKEEGTSMKVEELNDDVLVDSLKPTEKTFEMVVSWWFGILMNSPKPFSQSISITLTSPPSFASLTPTEGGKKHLLKNIRRRRRSIGNKAFSSMKPEVEELKKEQSMLASEILKLTQHHKESQVQLTNVEERVRCTELKQFQMMVFLTRMVKMPSFGEQLMHKAKRKGELDGQHMIKRCKFDTVSDVGYRHQGYEQLDKLQQTVTFEDEGSRTIGYDAYDAMSEKLMGESYVVDEEMDVNGSNIYLELEDLITKPANLGHIVIRLFKLASVQESGPYLSEPVLYDQAEISCFCFGWVQIVDMSSNSCSSLLCS
ncbi:hypothetical protein VNO77_23153 [Canavalia gladiata]|uniref:Uncharacterized protein n=1 Tax=Canavalia gladiata TaxID=3824 RepID=A0AAN9L4G3_CANGL